MEPAINLFRLITFLVVGGLAWLVYKVGLEVGPTACFAFAAGYIWHLVEIRVRTGKWP